MKKKDPPLDWLAIRLKQLKAERAGSVLVDNHEQDMCEAWCHTIERDQGKLRVIERLLSELAPR